MTGSYASRRATLTLIAKPTRERSLITVKILVGLTIYTVLGSWFYSEVAVELDDFLRELPQELSALMGGGLADATGGYVISVMMTLVGPLVFVGLAISWGASSIAGEEEAGTARLLFAQPVSRRQALATQVLSIAVVVFSAAALFAASIALASTLFSDPGPAIGNIVAATVQMALLALAMGMIGCAAATVTGSRYMGVGTGSAVAFISYVVDSFAPLTAAAGIEKFTPWYLFSGNDPIDNGINAGHCAIQLLLVVIFFALAAASVTTRDLETVSPRRFRGLTELAVGSHPLSSVGARARSRDGRLALLVGFCLATLAVLMSLLYGSVGESLSELELPRGVSGALGGGSFGTPAGWMELQLLAVVAPLLVIGLAVAIGADSVAGERGRETLPLVLATSTSRRSFLTAKLLSMTLAIIGSGAFLVIGLVVGSSVADLGLSTSGVVAATTQLVALALFFGSFATLVGVVRPKAAAVRLTGGAAVAAFLTQGLGQAVGEIGWLTHLSPWAYYAGNSALESGVSLTGVAVLVGLAVAAASTSLHLFGRQDVI